MAAANSITVTAQALLTAAMQKLGVLAGGEQPSFDDSALVLQDLQMVLDTFNAKRQMVYANTFSSFTLNPGLAPPAPNTPTPHTIGPTGTFVVNQRPVEIPSIGLQLTNSTPLTEIPLYQMTKDEWALERIKSLTSTFPTKYYYEPDWPNGSIFFWPFPTAVNSVLIQQRGVIGQITTYNANFTMPPGYWAAVVYSLARAIAPSFERTFGPELQALLTDALRAVQSNNVKSPRGSTLDSGMPGKVDAGGFNWLTGQPN